MSGVRGIRRIDEFDLKNKNVFLRVDFNVPLQDGKISDDTRIRAAIPTIQYALDHGAKLVVASHLGRPKTDEKSRKEFSMEPIAQRLNELLHIEVILADDPASDAPKSLLPGLKSNQLILLENLRFDKGETENDREFASHLASYTEIYINDAFGASHRAHATIDELPRMVKQKGIGFLMAKEVEMLDRVLHNPERPFVAVLGGAKVSDKIGVIERLMEQVDSFIIGGAMAYTFLKAQGFEVGDSRIEKDKLGFARELLGRLDAHNKQILLPKDHVVAQKFDASSEARTTSGPSIDQGWMGLDIGPQTITSFAQMIQPAKTVFWNGPMGVFEMKPFSRGTFAIAEAIANNQGITIVGGGDSAAAAKASGFAQKFSHISTGGGASLEYLEGAKLPGLEVLREKTRGPA